MGALPHRRTEIRGLRLDQSPEQPRTDYLIVAGIASIKLPIVIQYAGPLSALFAAGIALVLFQAIWMGPRQFKDHWFEKSMFCYGFNTGTLVNGVMLLRIIDPNMKSRSMETYAVVGLVDRPMIIALIALGPALIGTGYAVHFALACSVLAIVPLVVSKLFGWWHRTSDVSLRSMKSSAKQKPTDVQRLDVQQAAAGTQMPPRRIPGGSPAEIRWREDEHGGSGEPGGRRDHRRRRHRAGDRLRLKRRGLDVAILDAGEPRPRASRGNFGLVWVQGKGAKNPAYARWSRAAALAWPAPRRRTAGRDRGRSRPAAGRRILSVPVGGGPRRQDRDLHAHARGP